MRLMTRLNWMKCIFSFFRFSLFIAAINVGSTLLIWSGVLFQLFSPPFFFWLYYGGEKKSHFEGLIQTRSCPRKRGVRLFRMCEMLLITPPPPCNSRPSTWLHLYGFVWFFLFFLLPIRRFTQIRVGYCRRLRFKADDVRMLRDWNCRFPRTRERQVSPRTYAGS